MSRTQYRVVMIIGIYYTRVSFSQSSTVVRSSSNMVETI